MSMHWQGGNESFPIVEIHDVRTEKFRADRYLGLRAFGVPEIGQFRIAGEADRLISLRGFASMEARRKLLTEFHNGPDWAAQRREVADLTRSEEVVLTRAITPASGLRLTLPADGVQMLVSELRFPEQIGNYHLWLRLLLRKAGLDPIAAFATLESTNDVPAVPVVKNRTQHIALLRRGGAVSVLPRELRGMLRYAPEILTLEPALSLVW
ncbi:MAG: hypothetical protein ABIQ30_15935 [Devosia sp.]